MKRARTALSIITLVAMSVVMLSSVSVSAFEINNGFVFFDAGEHVDSGLRCPEERNAYIYEVQTSINDFFSMQGLILPVEPEVIESDSAFENVAAMIDYMKRLPIRFYARSHRVSNEGLTGFALFKSIANPELFHTIAIENQSGTRIMLPVGVFSTHSVRIEELEAAAGVALLDPTPYTRSDPFDR